MKRTKHIFGETTLGFAGLVSWRLIDAETGIVKRESPPHPNLIVDAGLEALANATYTSIFAAADECEVGTDNTAPAVTDTALGLKVAGPNADISFNMSTVFDAGVPEAYASVVFTYSFGKSEANDNLAEVGFRGGAADPLWSRQLFVDAAGDPTIITKTSSEILEVRYEVRCYLDLVDPIKSTSVSADVRGTPTATTVEWQWQQLDTDLPPANDIPDFHDSFLTDNFRWLTGYEDNTPQDSAGAAVWTGRGPATTSPSASIQHTSGGTVALSRDGPNHRVDLTWTIDSASLNFAGGIGAIDMNAFVPDSGDQNLIWFFNPKLDKTDTDELVFTMRFNLGRATI